MTHSLYHRYAMPTSAESNFNVLVEKVSVAGLVQYCPTSDAMPEFQAVLRAYGLSLPDPVRVISAIGLHVLAVAPSRYWVLQTEAGSLAHEVADQGQNDQTVDLQSSRLVVKLTGLGVADVLSCLVPNDLCGNNFAAGQLLDTLADGIPATIWRASDTGVFYAATPLSYAQDFLSRLPSKRTSAKV